MVVWTQGIAASSIDPHDEWPFDPGRIATARLPDAFLIGAQCRACRAFANAIGIVERGAWSRTIVPEKAALATQERAFENEPGRRRCGLCDNVWVCAPTTLIADCPGCGATTVLASGAHGWKWVGS